MMTAARDKTRSADEQSPSGIREDVLAAEHGTPEDAPDVEGVLVRVDDENVTLTLEDGERLVFNATELRSILRAA